jgi:hypothetical protein
VTQATTISCSAAQYEFRDTHGAASMGSLNRYIVLEKYHSGPYIPHIRLHYSPTTLMFFCLIYIVKSLQILGQAKLEVMAHVLS